MNKLLISLLTLCGLVGCSLNSSDLSISCEGKLTNSSKINGRFDSYDEKSTKVFHFKDKTIHKVTCSEWTKEKIHCLKVTEDSEGTNHYTLDLDRISGAIIIFNKYYFTKDQSNLSYMFQGQCVKLEGAKI